MRNFAPSVFLLLLIAIFLRVDFFFTIVYFLGAIYVLSRLWMGRLPGQLRIDRDFVDHAFSGEQVTVTLAVRNTGWLPIPWLELRESLPVALVSAAFPLQVVGLGPHAHWQVKYTLNCRRRGYYPVGPLDMQIGDLLGLAQFSLRGVDPRRLTIYPRIVPLQRLGLPTRSPMVALPARSPLFEDPSRIQGVRDYRRGDAPRRIHWSASAHARRLVVKQYEPAIARETLICLDLDADSYDRHRLYEASELAIVVAASLATHIVVKERLPVGLLTAAQDPLIGALRKIAVPPHTGRAHLVAHVLEPLARIQVTDGAAFADLLREESARFAWGLTLVVVTGRAGPALFDLLLALQRRGFAVSLILVQPPVAPESPGAAPARLLLPVYRVWSEEDLAAWR